MGREYSLGQGAQGRRSASEVFITSSIHLAFFPHQILWHHIFQWQLYWDTIYIPTQFTHLKGTHSVVFSIFTDMYNHRHSQFRMFHHLKKKLCTIWWLPSYSSIARSMALSNHGATVCLEITLSWAYQQMQLHNTWPFLHLALDPFSPHGLWGSAVLHCV